MHGGIGRKKHRMLFSSFSRCVTEFRVMHGGNGKNVDTPQSTIVSSSPRPPKQIELTNTLPSLSYGHLSHAQLPLIMIAGGRGMLERERGGEREEHRTIS
jgi:hypothetical protein